MESLSKGELLFPSFSVSHVLIRFSNSRIASTQGKAVDSLRSDLASAHAKLEELKTEVNVLRSQASRSKDLSSDKATLLSQQETLSKVRLFPQFAIFSERDLTKPSSLTGFTTSS